MSIQRIISGGQSGVDRAALDVAIERNLPCGGWCPRGRWAEDGRIDEHYPLTETESDDPAARTRCNVRDADGTLIIVIGVPDGGTALTHELAGELDKPCLLVDPRRANAVEIVLEWLERAGIGVLNVAGPRESEWPGIYRHARRLLEQLVAVPA
jgi:hypothetical protein